MRTDRTHIWRLQGALRHGFGLCAGFALCGCILPGVDTAMDGGSATLSPTGFDATAMQESTTDAETEPAETATASGSARPARDAGVGMQPIEPREPDPMAAGAPAMGQAKQSTAEPPPAMNTVSTRELAVWPMPDSTPGSRAAPNYISSADTVLDNVTQLVWQRTLPPVYEDCTGQLDADAAVGTLCHWEEAKNYCASLELKDHLGGSGWRLPTLIELASLLQNFTGDPPTIDARAFPQTPPESFVSATLMMNDLPTIGLVNFGIGSIQHGPTGPEEWGMHVRCVRSEALAPSIERYDIRDSVVSDRLTGLTWRRAPAPTKLDWVGAVNYCGSLGEGWRLPAQKELYTLVDPTVPSPLANQTIYQFLEINANNMAFWSVTADLNRSIAYKVDFWRGWSLWDNGGQLSHVRCVR